VRHISDTGTAQLHDPAAENYVTVASTRDGLAWQLGPANDYVRHPWNQGIDLRLTAGSLSPGDTVTIVLGDPAGGCPGFRCQSWVETHFRFRLGINCDGKGDWRVQPESQSPGFQIVGNTAVALRVIVPRMTERANRRECRLKAEDAFGNVAGAGPRSAVLLLDGAKPVGRADIEPDRAATAEAAAPADDRWHTFVAATDDGALWSRSNPFGPSPVEGYHLYWGEIHGQSGLCDGTNSPAEIYTYAREAAGLDFASVSSHDFELTAENWEEIRGATRDAHEPGRFVTFLGYEWSGDSSVGGDNNIYFLDDEGPLVYSAPFEAHRAWDPAEGQVRQSRTLRETITALAGRPVLVVPHCGGRRCNFDFYDPAVMPLFEIHSCHRTYEFVARETMSRGLRFGFIAGSDDHRGALGDSHPAARDRFASSHSGLAAVYAKELTRESLWEAIFAKRAYATNGPRIVLDFRVNNVLMGGAVTAVAGEKIKFRVWARLDGLLDRIDLLRDGEVIQNLQGLWNQYPEFRAEWERPAEPGRHAYHVVVYQTDGGKAWASPIWVDAAE
jgi:hypothetical protein